MATEITIQQYLTKEALGLAAWGGKDCLRLEVLMDYSEPFRRPGAAAVSGSAAIRWSVLSTEFGNGLHASNGDATRVTQAILIAFLYAKVLALDSMNRAELFRRVQDAIELCSDSDDWSWLNFQPWSLPEGSVVWPWAIEPWDKIEARRGDAFENIQGVNRSLMKTYSATLLNGPIAPFAPQGWWLRFQQPDPDLARVMMPASSLIAMSHFLSEKKNDMAVSSLIRRINRITNRLTAFGPERRRWQ